MRLRYDVRVINADGKLVVKKRFVQKDKAFNFAKDKMRYKRRVGIRPVQIPDRFTIVDSSKWGVSKHTAYQYATGPLRQLFLHTSVTKQLPATATVAQEMAEMRHLDAIAKARGFNGISYSFCVFPSGRAYEGRGWLVVEAATAPYNEESDSICFVGNTDAFKPTKEQLDSARRIIERGQKYDKLVKTRLNLRGHREVAAKACPGRFVTPEIIAAMQHDVNKAA